MNLARSARSETKTCAPRKRISPRTRIARPFASLRILELGVEAMAVSHARAAFSPRLTLRSGGEHMGQESRYEAPPWGRFGRGYEGHVRQNLIAGAVLAVRRRAG